MSDTLYYLYNIFFLVAPAARQGAPCGAQQGFHPRHSLTLVPTLPMPTSSSYAAGVHNLIHSTLHICLIDIYNVKLLNNNNLRMSVCTSVCMSAFFMHFSLSDFITKHTYGFLMTWQMF